MRNSKQKLIPIFALLTLLCVTTSLLIIPLVSALEHTYNAELVLVDTNLEEQSSDKEGQEEEDSKEEKEEMFMMTFYYQDFSEAQLLPIFSELHHPMDCTIELHFPPPERV